MRLSVSSLFISLIIVLCLTIILTFQLKIERIGKYNSLILVYFFIFCRLLLPFEWSWTKTIPSRVIMPAFQNFFAIEIQGISIGYVLLLIWFIGFIISIFFLIKEIIGINNYSKRTEHKKSTGQLDFSFVNKVYRERIYSNSTIDSPILVNVLRPMILIPNIEYSKQELKYIILHEIQHIKNKDLIVKLFLEVLTAIYWWFPPIYFLKNQLSFLMELRVDNQVTSNLCELEQLDYANTLISVKKKAEKRKKILALDLVSNFTYPNKFLLTKRMNLFFEGNAKKSNRLALLPLIFMLLLLPSIVFEPYQIDTLIKETTFEINEPDQNFILETLDGNYYLYENNQKIGSITDPMEAPFNELKIYREEETQ